MERRTLEERHRSLELVEKFWGTRPHRSLAQLIDDLGPGDRNISDSKLCREITRRLDGQVG